jgi:hypothetical protein
MILLVADWDAPLENCHWAANKHAAIRAKATKL